MKHSCTSLLILLLVACAQPVRLPEPPPEQTPAQRMNEVAFYALSLADTPYRYGGSQTNSFDCSGFVQHVFLYTLGIQLPRTSTEMSHVGGKPTAEQLQPGDLVFFNTTATPYSHVGIYLGDQRFVHAPSSGKGIMVTSMQASYWRKRYNGARRITWPLPF